MSYKKQELLTHREHLSSALVFGGVGFAHRCSFLCCMLYVSLEFALSNGVGVVHFILLYVFYVLSLNNICQDQMTHTCLHDQFVDQV